MNFIFCLHVESQMINLNILFRLHREPMSKYYYSDALIIYIHPLIVCYLDVSKNAHAHDKNKKFVSVVIYIIDHDR